MFRGGSSRPGPCGVYHNSYTSDLISTSSLDHGLAVTLYHVLPANMPGFFYKPIRQPIFVFEGAANLPQREDSLHLPARIDWPRSRASTVLSPLGRGRGGHDSPRSGRRHNVDATFKHADARRMRRRNYGTVRRLGTGIWVAGACKWTAHGIFIPLGGA